MWFVTPSCDITMCSLAIAISFDPSLPLSPSSLSLPLPPPPPKQVKDTYCKFLYHCYIDTEVDNKETFTRDYLWDLFKCFVMDIGVVRFADHQNYC